MNALTDWVPQSLYLEAFKETKDTINERIKRKHWVKGIHYNVPPGSKGRWINLKAVNEWASGKPTAAYQVAS